VSLHRFATAAWITFLDLARPGGRSRTLEAMLWEAIFLLLVLKIPIVYMCLVVWWAIRAEPREEQPAAVSRVSDTPSGPPPPPAAPLSGGPRTPRGPRRRDDGRVRRERSAPRPALARGEDRR
jgi:hypothetical protein